MLRERTSRLTDQVLSGGAWIAALAAAVVGASLMDETRYKEWPRITAIVVAIRDSAWWSFPATTIIAAILTRLRSNIGSSRKWKTVQVLLDHYREETFGKNEFTKDDPQHYHRITIFKHVRWRTCLARWPWSGWMVPLARSGFATKSRISCFRADPDKPNAAEGIAGRAFVSMKTISVDDLPDLTGARANEDDIKRYAERTFISANRAGRRLPSARSIMGIPLEVNGKPWGSVVLDSHNPREIPQKKPIYGTLAKVLNELLQ